MYIAITGLKPKNFFSKLRFWFLAIPSFRAAQKAEGNLFCEVKEETIEPKVKSIKPKKSTVKDEIIDVEVDSDNK